MNGLSFVILSVVKAIVLFELVVTITLALLLVAVFFVVNCKVDELDNSDYSLHCGLGVQKCVKSVLYTPYNNCSDCSVYNDYLKNGVERGE